MNEKHLWSLFFYCKNKPLDKLSKREEIFMSKVLPRIRSPGGETESRKRIEERRQIQ